MRKFVAASLVLVIVVAVAAADEFVGFITKFDDGKMSVKKSKGTERREDPLDDIGTREMRCARTSALHLTAAA